MEKLDITDLQKQIKTLEESWVEYQKDTSNSFIRDSVIQRFEYTYEGSYKFMMRSLSVNFGIIDIKSKTFTEIIRLANEKELLLNDLEKWARYREKRNLTSHTYNQDTALEVISIIEDYIIETNYLVRKLLKINS